MIVPKSMFAYRSDSQVWAMQLRCHREHIALWLRIRLNASILSADTRVLHRKREANGVHEQPRWLL